MRGDKPVRYGSIMVGAGDQTASPLPANSLMNLNERIGFVFSLDYFDTRRHLVFGGVTAEFSSATVRTRVGSTTC
jgi:hypothetical protein